MLLTQMGLNFVYRGNEAFTSVTPDEQSRILVITTKYRRKNDST